MTVKSIFRKSAAFACIASALLIATCPATSSAAGAAYGSSSTRELAPDSVAGLTFRFHAPKTKRVELGTTEYVPGEAHSFRVTWDDSNILTSRKESGIDSYTTHIEEYTYTYTKVAPDKAMVIVDRAHTVDMGGDDGVYREVTYVYCLHFTAAGRGSAYLYSEGSPVLGLIQATGTFSLK